MNLENIKNKTILSGLKVRTKNSEETSPLTSKIGPLWGEFYEKVRPQLKENAVVYGVYTNYESDFSGEFDVLACADQEISNLDKVEIKQGDYLVFSGKGAMPQVVIDVWGEVWKYFSSESCEHQRAYDTDFELYESDSEVKVYIGIK